jgi:micrococcal nuclease
VSRRPILRLSLICLAASGCGTEGVVRMDAERELRGRVVAVVDGDTLRVQVAGERERVRLLGIDTPESGRPDTPVECGSKSAARHLRDVADGKSVVLRTDPTQDRRDRFGRLLAYADLPGGRDLGEEQVRAGWAKPYVFERAFARLARYRSAQARARRERLGVFRFCGGDFHG